MSSKSKDIMESQKTLYEQAVLKRMLLLKDRGLDEAVIFKDRRLKSLKGKVRQMNRRLLTIADIAHKYEVVRNRDKEPVVVKPEKRRPKVKQVATMDPE